MKIGDARHRDASYRFVVSAPTAHGWQDFVALMKNTPQDSPRDACQDVAQALGRDEPCHIRTGNSTSNDHRISEGAHVILGSAEALSSASPARLTSAAPAPTHVPMAPKRPPALRFTALPEPPERNAMVHIASALLPLLAAVGFAVFAKSYWFLMLALTSPILVVVTSRAQASMHGRRLRAVQSQNFAAFHLQRASHMRYLDDLASHLEATHGCIEAFLTGTSSPAITQAAGELAIRLGAMAVTRDIDFDHDIAREIASMRTRIVTDRRDTALNLPADPRLQPNDVHAFASHLTGADIGLLHLQSTHTVPALVLVSVPASAPDAAFGRATVAAGVGLSFAIEGNLAQARSFAAWIVIQCLQQLRNIPVGVQAEGCSASWLSRGLMWVPPHTSEHEWLIKVAESPNAAAGSQSARLEILIFSPGATQVNASMRLVLQGESATQARAAQVSWAQPLAATPSPHHVRASPEDPRAIAEIRRDSMISWEGISPVEWDDWMRAYTRHHTPTGLNALQPVSFSTLHTPSTGSTDYTTAPMGAGVLGAVLHDDAIAPLEFNLIDDGPHMFVAGTTGSGKSEFLRSLVASLCFHASPRFTQLVLLDFKGGAGFDELSTLDHVAEVVTNLDERAAMRTLESLSAEMRRRQLLFRDAGVSSWPEYFERKVLRSGAVHGRPSSTDGAGADHSSEVSALSADIDDALTDTDAAPDALRDAPFSVPRLIIVVDEFRVLLDDYPESRAAFTRIAALGRSLGVHLVLATQRPGGSLSPDLAANVGLRVCLRVNDRLESIETLGSPVAASISRNTPGRAYVTRESSALSEEPLLFQSTMLGADSHHEPENAHTPRIQLSRYGHDVPTREASTSADQQATLLWLARQCSTVGPLPDSPILPPLPRLLNTLQLVKLATSESHTGLPLGALDDPAHLCYRTLLWQPSAGHTVIVGAAGSGKSHTLRLLVGLVARQLSAHEATSDAAASRSEAANPGTLASITRIQVLSAGGPDEAPEVYKSAAVTQISHRDLDALTAWLDALEVHATAVDTGRTLVCIDDLDRLITELTPTNYQAADAGTRSALLARIQQFVSSPHAHCSLVVTGSRKVLSSPAMNASDQFILLRPSEPQDYSLLGVQSQKAAALDSPGRCYVKVAGADILEGQILANSDAAIEWLHRSPIR